MEFKPSRRTQLTGNKPQQSRYERLAPITVHAPKRRINKKIVFAAVLIVIAGIYFVTRSKTTPPPPQPVPQSQSPTTADTKKQGSISTDKPDFAALTPGDKDVAWSHLKSPSGDSFYVYTDTVGGAAIRVSQQQLPQNFKGDTSGQLAELAKNYNANRTLIVAGTTIYIGSDTKGQQSLLFTQRSLLIMITCDAVLNDHQWTEYINSLQ